MLQFPNRIKGIAIPLVIIALMMGMGILLLYISTIRSQNRLDTLFEQDLRAYYISESGFQYAVGKLYESKRYEERWYSPQKFIQLQKEFGYDQKVDRGVFQIYLTEVQEEQVFSHLFLISKGIYYTGKVFPDGKKERVVSIIKGNLAYSPKPPSNAEQTLIIVNKAPINQKVLLSLINQPEYQALFNVENGAVPTNIRTLLEFLKTNRLEDIDFISEPALMQGIALLEHLNQKVLRLKRLSKLIDDPALRPNDFPDFEQYFMNQSGVISGIGEARQIFEGIIEEGQDVNQSSKNFSKKLKDLKRVKKAQIISNEIFDLVQYFPPETVVSYPGSNSQSSAQLSTGTIEDFRKLVIENSTDAALWDQLIRSKVQFGLPSQKPAKLIDLADASGLTQTVENLADRDQKSAVDAGDFPAPDYSKPAIDPQGQLADQNNMQPGTSLSEENQTGLKSTLELSDPHDQGGRVEILKTLYEPYFDEIGSTDLSGVQSLEQGFLKVFLDALQQELHEFALETDLMWERKPTPQEYQRFLEQHSIPSLETIKKLSQQLDSLFASGNFTYHFGANINDPLNRKGGAAVYTVVERQAETMRTELLNKLETYYFSHGSRTDDQFLKMFKNSTWGDSASANYMGKGEGYNDSAHKTDYFIRHKTSGEETLLYDYLKDALR